MTVDDKAIDRFRRCLICLAIGYADIIILLSVKFI